ncbi:MAG: c-type cytochrome [Azovibrio sp.]
MKYKLGLILLLSLAASVHAAGVSDSNARLLQQFSSDPETLKAAQEAGRKASFFCVNCHGESGVSKIPEVPNLAGQNPSYLLVQTQKFGNGQRKDEFMQGLIRVLKEEEKAKIALFYASQNPLPGKQDPAMVAEGAKIFAKVCARCHGDQARGNEEIPRLAGQHPQYLQVSITRYRDKTGVRQDPLMSSAVALLKDSDIKAVAAYLNTLP